MYLTILQQVGFWVEWKKFIFLEIHVFKPLVAGNEEFPGS